MSEAPERTLSERIRAHGFSDKASMLLTHATKERWADEVATLEQERVNLRRDLKSLRTFVASDGMAITYQSMGHYRRVILDEIDNALAAEQGEPK